jgi:hypothetical protein
MDGVIVYVPLTRPVKLYFPLAASVVVVSEFRPDTVTEIRCLISSLTTLPVTLNVGTDSADALPPPPPPPQPAKRATIVRIMLIRKMTMNLTVNIYESLFHKINSIIGVVMNRGCFWFPHLDRCTS